jgi:hypothetical protein
MTIVDERGIKPALAAPEEAISARIKRERH